MIKNHTRRKQNAFRRISATPSIPLCPEPAAERYLPNATITIGKV